MKHKPLSTGQIHQPAAQKYDCTRADVGVMLMFMFSRDTFFPL